MHFVHCTNSQSNPEYQAVLLVISGSSLALACLPFVLGDIEWSAFHLRRKIFWCVEIPLCIVGSFIGTLASTQVMAVALTFWTMKNYSRHCQISLVWELPPTECHWTSSYYLTRWWQSLLSYPYMWNSAIEDTKFIRRILVLKVLLYIRMKWELTWQ